MKTPEKESFADMVFPEGKELKNKFEEEKKKLRTIEKVEMIPFSTEKKLGILTEKKISKNLKGSVLFLIKSDRTVDLFEDVKPGFMNIKIGENQARIILAESKLLTFKHGTETINGWVHYEQEALSYPLDKLHDSLELERLFRGIMLNYKQFEEKSAGWKLETFIGIGALLILAAMAYGMISNGQPAPAGATPEDILNTTKTIGFIIWG